MAFKELVQVIVKAKDELSRPMKQAGAAVDSFNKEVQSSSKAVGNVTKSLIALAGAYVGLRVVKNTINDLIEVGAEVQSTKTQLDVLYGSTERAAEAFNYMNSVAGRVPYTFRNVVKSGLTLKRFGMEVENWLEPLTNLAAFMDVELTDAASALGRAYSAGAGAADVFRERGILNVIREFKGIDDITKLTLPEFRRAMLETFTESTKISGMTARLAEDWTGMVSMLEDAWFQFRIEIMQGGFFEYLQEKLRLLLQRISELRESGDFKRWAEEISRNLVKAAEAAIRLYDVAKKVYEFLADKKYIIAAIAIFVTLNAFLTKAAIAIGGVRAALIALGVQFGVAGVAATGFAAVMNAITFAGFVTSVVFTTSKLLELIDVLRKYQQARREEEEVERWKGEREITAAEELREYIRLFKTAEKMLEPEGFAMEGIPDQQEFLRQWYHKLTPLAIGPPGEEVVNIARQTFEETGADLLKTAREVRERIRKRFEEEGWLLRVGRPKPEIAEEAMPGVPAGMPDFGREPAKEDPRIKEIKALVNAARKRSAEWQIARLQELKTMAKGIEQIQAIEAEIERVQQRVLAEQQKEKEAEETLQKEIQDRFIKRQKEDHARYEEMMRRRAQILAEAYGDEWDLRKIEVEDAVKEMRKFFEDDAEMQTAIDRIRVSRLKEIEKEKQNFLKAQAGYYADFNLAMLQRMLRDERTAQEEKYRIRTEINRRIEEDEIGQREAMMLGWEESLENFQNTTQTMMDFGRNAAENLRSAFENTFFNFFKGEINSLKDLWGSFMDYMRDAFLRAMAEMMAAQVMSKIFGRGPGGRGGETAIMSGAGAIAGAMSGGKSWIAGVAGQIASFAGGGVEYGNRLAMLHGPEAVIPLEGGAVPVKMLGRAGTVRIGTYIERVEATDADSFRAQMDRQRDIMTGAVMEDIESGGALRNYIRGD